MRPCSKRDREIHLVHRGFTSMEDTMKFCVFMDLLNYLYGINQW